MSNLLARETSPYLLQHAGNPVEWYPWGEEALSLAKRDDRPILLSIGYSACHWCHVMERESFEDPDVARLMNRWFVNVKVDREERPDVDAVYMRAVQALTGQGGWPLTVFLTPEGLPFYGGTYFPPEPRHGMPSFSQLLQAVHAAYDERRDEVERSAGEIRELLRRSVESRGARAEEPDSEGRGDPDAHPDRLLDAADAQLATLWDPVNGGIGRAPKFPQPTTLAYALRRTTRSRERSDRLQPILRTLRAMARGGIRDHLGGGFHRYAVDERWLVPHFEKMLYDNALLAGVYLDAWKVTNDPELLSTARGTLDYLLTDLRSPEGGFYSARDADSEGVEGRYYVWSPGEVEEVLGAEDAALFGRVYDVTSEGNFEGASILNRPNDPSEAAREEGLDPVELERILERSRKRLLEARSRRAAPLRDEKVLTSWNAFAIRSLARAGAALGDDRYLEAARQAARFLLEQVREGDRLLHVWTAGSARIPAFLEDQAAIGNALLDLHEATLEPTWLASARETARELLPLFQDPETGLLFDTAADAEQLVVRPRDVMDNPTPSGTSQAAELLYRMGRIDDRAAWIEEARALVASEAEGMRRSPSFFGHLLGVADSLAAPPVEVVLAGGPGGRHLDELLQEVHLHHLPEILILAGERGTDPGGPDGHPSTSPDPAPTSPLARGKGAVDGLPAAYVCRGGTCASPVTGRAELARAMAAVRNP